MLAAPRPPRPSDKRHKPPLVLLTGFDAFGGDPVNPSWLLAQALHRRQIAGHRVLAAQLPTQFGASIERLHALLTAHPPALVVCLGLAAGRAALSLERIAINVDDARIADNAGARPIDTPVIAGAPAAYFSTLPIKAMRAAIEAAGAPADISQSAGTFVCNHLFYGLMHQLARMPALRDTRGGFIHVPPLPEQGVPSLPLAVMAAGLSAGICAALTVRDDLRVGGGALH